MAGTGVHLACGRKNWKAIRQGKQREAEEKNLGQNINVNMPLSLTSHRTKSNDQIQVLICFEYSAACDTVDQYFHPEAFNSAYTPSFPSSLLLVFPSILVGSSSSFLYWQRSILGHFLLAGYTYSLVDLTHGHGLKKTSIICTIIELYTLKWLKMIHFMLCTFHNKK